LNLVSGGLPTRRYDRKSDDVVRSAQQTAVLFLHLRAFAPPARASAELRENFFSSGDGPEFICQSATGDIP
jgi:hypothetical protein